jgi:predicted RNA-binding protein YlxR (DUF448 family)
VSITSTRRCLRTCIACRKSEDPAKLVRVVLKDGYVIPDIKGGAGGRGAWLHLACGYVAIERKAFKWAFKLTEMPDVSVLKQYLQEKFVNN